MLAATTPKVTITMYNDLPAGQLGLSQMWSGDIVNAQYYLPKGAGPEILRYWFPADGKGMVDNDLMVVLTGGKNPVLAHLFLNLMLDPENGQAELPAHRLPAAAELDGPPSRLVAEGYIPANLTRAIVKPEWFDVGYRLLELAAAKTPPGTTSGARSRPAS